MARRVAEAVERQLAELPRLKPPAGHSERQPPDRDQRFRRCGDLQPVRPGAPDHSDPQRPRTGRWHYQRRFGILVTGHRNRQVITPPAPTTFYRLTVTPPPVPASGWQISKRMTVQELSKEAFRAGFDH